MEERRAEHYTIYTDITFKLQVLPWKEILFFIIIII